MGDFETEKPKSSGEIELARQLQKTFISVFKTADTWSALTAESDPAIKALLNLSEQQNCCDSVDLKTSPLSAFPDIKERVKTKLALSMAENISKLEKIM